MAEIQGGINPEFPHYVLIQNRKTAIEFIINQSGPNDVVLLAGKGHETSQITKFKTAHLDDREQATRAIRIRLKTETTISVPQPTYGPHCSLFAADAMRR